MSSAFVLFRCGSGCIASFLASLLQRLSAIKQSEAPPAVFFTVDKQVGALEATQVTFCQNNSGALVEGIAGDLFKALRCTSRNPVSGSGGTARAEAGCAAGGSLAKQGFPYAERSNDGKLFDLILFNPVSRQKKHAKISQ